MLARFTLSLTLILGLATVSFAQDKKTEKKKSDDLTERVLNQVKKSLKKYEKELGEKKFDSILKSVENSLSGKANRFEFKIDSFDPSMIQDHLKIIEGKAKLDPKKLVPHIIHLDGGKKRRVIGVMLQGEGDGPIKVQKVMKDSAAEKAGIKSGDMIVKVNGKEVKGSKALTDAIQKSKGSVKVTLKRNKKQVEVKVEPKEVAGSAIQHALIELDNIEIPDVQLDKAKAILKGIGKDGKIIELHEHLLKDGDIIKKLPHGAKGHKIIQVKPHADGKSHGIIEANPGDIKKHIELKIDRVEDAKRLIRNKLQDKKIVERHVELKSDLAETLEKLQKQMKELQKEIESLKKSKN